jgi:hypothetical protein
LAQKLMLFFYQDCCFFVRIHNRTDLPQVSRREICQTQGFEKSVTTANPRLSQSQREAWHMPPTRHTAQARLRPTHLSCSGRDKRLLGHI